MPRLLLLLCSLFICCHSLQAGFPVTHIYLCQRWMDLNTEYSPEQRRDCILGTLFPDIRHLGVIARELTHEAGVDLKMIRESANPFQAGMRLHVWVDSLEQTIARDLLAKELVKAVPDEDLRAFIKILEDQVLYDRVDMGPILRYLEIVVDAERDFGIHPTFLYMWHSLLRRYLENEPSAWIHHLARTHQNFHWASRATVAEWDKHLLPLSEQKPVLDYVEKLVDLFEEAFMPNSSSVNAS